MTEPATVDPAVILSELDARHDDVLRKLDELNRQIERVLADDRIRGGLIKTPAK